MYPKLAWPQPSRLALVSALVSLGVLTVSPPVHATSSFLNSWRSTYPDSASASNLETPCTLCHNTGAFSQLNGYGWDFKQNGYSFTAIESLNSDRDPGANDNLSEIEAGTQPGWTEGAHNIINGGAISETAEPTELVAGSFDPAGTNQAPVADIGGPYAGTQDMSINFDASGSSDGDGSIAAYAWDFGDGSTASGVRVAHAYSATGSFNVTLIVTDDKGDTTTAMTTVTIGAGNQAPVAEAMGPYAGLVGQSVSFDASGSSDADGQIVSYDWSFGDGASGTGVKPTHSYAAKGTYNVTLTVTDDKNAVDSDVASVSIEQPNQAPIADPSGPYIGTAGDALSFDGSGSSDADGSISSYVWDFGDNSTGTGANPSHTYDRSGSYNVTLRVTDNGGLSGTGITTATIGDIANEPPVANAGGPYMGTANMAISFNANASNDPDGTIASYVWDFGDGSSGTGVAVSHAYAAEGTYNVTLKVTDNDGIMDSATVTVVIGTGNISPTADASGPYSAIANTSVSFDGSGSTDPDGSIVAYDWDFGDNTTGTGVRPTHTYTQAGTYNVTLTVYDDSGAMDADVTTVQVTVDNPQQDTTSAGSATITKRGDWGSGFQGDVVVKNTRSQMIGHWQVSFDADFAINQIWNAQIVSHTGTTYVIKGLDWNKTLSAGAEVGFGFIGAPGNRTMPASILVTDLQRTTGSDTDGQVSTQVSMSKANDWGTGFQGLGTIRNTGSNNLTGWTLSFDAGFEITQIWNAEIVSHSGTKYVIKDSGWNRDIAAGEQVSFGFVATPGGSAMPTQFVVNGDNVDNGATPNPDPIPDPDPISDACSGETTYGPRSLKLLTRIEYQNSIEDLVGIDFNVSGSIPFDALIEGYFNNAFVPVTESHADAYIAVAEKVANWSAQRNFQGVVDCGFDSNGNTSVSYQECQSRFLNDFGARVFRRPLSGAEMTSYQAVFNTSLTGGDIKEGLKLGVTALLTAPQFLYRSEAGVAVSVLQAGGGTSVSGDAVTVNGADFQTKSTGGADGSGWNIWSDGYIQNSFTLTDNAQFQISMKGDAAQGVWPEMQLVIDGTVVGTQTVDSSSYQSYAFDVAGYSGSHTVQVVFTNDYYENGEDRNLYVQSVSVSGTQSNAAVADTLDLSTLDSDAYVLNSYEIASFLSYTLTGSTPDSALLEAAKNGELSTDAQVEQQVARLLATEKAKAHMAEFAAQWLGSDEVINAQKDMTLFPDFTPEVREAMAAEVKAFFTHVFFSQDQGFSDLFSADYVYVNNALANFYGLGSVGTNSSDPADFVQVDATAAHRGGLLTMGAFLANEADLAESSPIKRAVNIRLRMLCQDIPKPDANIATFRAEEMEKVLQELQGKAILNRDFVAAMTKESPCSACHDEIINPLGFSMEDYDASGRYRSVDHNGLSINSTGTLYGVNSLYDGQTLSLSGGKDLSDQFAELDSVKACFSSNVFRYAMNVGHDAIDAANEQLGTLTTEEKRDYSCSVDNLTSTLASSNSMADLFTRMTTLDLVRFRKQRDR